MKFFATLGGCWVLGGWVLGCWVLGCWVLGDSDKTIQP